MSRRKIKPRRRGRDEFENLVPFEPRIGGYREQGSLGPRERAEVKMYEAFDTPDRRTRRRLAEEALAIYSDCTAALAQLGDDAEDPEEAFEFYRRAVEAGERDLGPKMFRRNRGRFWEITETRPYMHAKHELAKALRASGRSDEAVDHFQEMLRLNPHDNQGARTKLLTLLIELDMDKEAARLLKRYEDDADRTMIYGNALLEFRKSGDSAKARQKLDKALEANEHVPAFLMGKKKMPRNLPDYHSLRDEKAAVIVVHESRSAWEKTPGALEWLEERISR